MEEDEDVIRISIKVSDAMMTRIEEDKDLIDIMEEEIIKAFKAYIEEETEKEIQLILNGDPNAVDQPKYVMLPGVLYDETRT